MVGAAVEMSGVKPEGTIEHIDVHVAKLEKECGGMDPNDPEDRKKGRANHLKVELKAAVKNLETMLKRINNRKKAEPIEQAIKRANDAIKKFSPTP